MHDNSNGHLVNTPKRIEAEDHQNRSHRKHTSHFQLSLVDDRSNQAKNNLWYWPYGERNNEINDDPLLNDCSEAKKQETSYESYRNHFHKQAIEFKKMWIIFLDTPIHPTLVEFAKLPIPERSQEIPPISLIRNNMTIFNYMNNRSSSTASTLSTMAQAQHPFPFALEQTLKDDLIVYKRMVHHALAIVYLAQPPTATDEYQEFLRIVAELKRIGSNIEFSVAALQHAIAAMHRISAMAKSQLPNQALIVRTLPQATTSGDSQIGVCAILKNVILKIKLQQHLAM